MATYDEVIEALRRADAAGNVEDARNLAEIANSMREKIVPVDSQGEEQSPFVLMGDQPPQCLTICLRKQN